MCIYTVKKQKLKKKILKGGVATPSNVPNYIQVEYNLYMVAR